ncbi:metallophosphoesterase [Pseudomonas sp. HR96]|uniref:metallophosphoesterase n=1 Tax=Pseudomonas sp. HR96 TaxID=1027966 RepID=UPI002A74C6C3|nr:metallophosphoesterase [Pseudomonas sp. HR96]WPP01866.1 metallophosphoesterase [Pseudomonas sp. HR96]
MEKFVHFAANQIGRDYAVGDIHGHFSRLQLALEQLGFNPACDRLFSVGDLIDRGPQSEDSLQWLEQPWFFAVQGNHEVLAVQLDAGQWLDEANYRSSGGGWLLDASTEKRRLYARRFAQMPVAMEVETDSGLIGLVHADCPFPAWAQLRSYLQGDGLPDRRTDEIFQWSRTRLKRNDRRGVEGVRAMIVGHTPLRVPKRLGNVYHIDTAGWSEGYFSFIDLATLEVLPVRAAEGAADVSRRSPPARASRRPSVPADTPPR